MIKKTLSIFLAALIIMGPYALYATGTGSNSGLAGGGNSGLQGGGNAGSIKNPLSGNPDLATLAAKILKILFLAGTVVAVFFIVYAGFKYVTAGGDPKAIQAAHSTLLWAAVGTAVLLGAQVIVDVITNTVKQLAS